MTLLRYRTEEVAGSGSTHPRRVGSRCSAWTDLATCSGSAGTSSPSPSSSAPSTPLRSGPAGSWRMGRVRVVPPAGWPRPPRRGHDGPLSHPATSRPNSEERFRPRFRTGAAQLRKV